MPHTWVYKNSANAEKNYFYFTKMQLAFKTKLTSLNVDKNIAVVQCE